MAAGDSLTRPSLRLQDSQIEAGVRDQEDVEQSGLIFRLHGAQWKVRIIFSTLHVTEEIKAEEGETNGNGGDGEE